jgi:hypothetical protein
MAKEKNVRGRLVSGRSQTHRGFSCRTIEDPERGDELENTFAQVLQDLAADESLVRFRSEYDKRYQEHSLVRVVS